MTKLLFNNNVASAEVIIDRIQADQHLTRMTNMIQVELIDKRGRDLLGIHLESEHGVLGQVHIRVTVRFALVI